MTTGGYQNFNEIYQKLPEEVKEAIFSVDTSNAIEEISSKYNFNIEQMGILSDEIGKIMMGLDHPRNFIANLKKNLKVKDEVARKIAEEVNEKIFAKIREALKRIHNLEGENIERVERGDSQGGVKTIPIEPNADEVIKKETLKVIEDEEGVSDKKEETQQKDILRRPPNVSEYYPEGDPYREPIE